MTGSVRVEELSGALRPVEALARFCDLPYCLLLESAARSSRMGRYSFLCADPFGSLRGRDGRVEVEGAAGREWTVRDPFSVLREQLERYARPAVPGLPPFQGGAAGYFAYDLCRQLEPVPAHRYDDLELPDLCLGLYDWTLAWDHERDACWLVSTGLPVASGPERDQRAERRAAWVRARLAGPPAPLPRPREAVHGAPGGPPTFAVPGLGGVRSTFSRDGYLAVVERVREYIRAGDIFQANLSQRLEAAAPEHPLALYRRLRERNPAPFAAYFDFGEAALLSSSPELFLRLDGARVETRPIKGTAPRGGTPEQDALLAGALRESDKDRAENTMIVDLLRNDLSIVCRDDSVEVPELCVVESYARVHHLVSSVVGELRPGADAVDLLRAAFPGGSITGAPKVRAMQIIAELEPTRRGPYTGALGYLGFDGAMDTSIVIRSFVVKDGIARFQVGGGIVIDSDPRREYLETLDKARGLLAAL